MKKFVMAALLVAIPFAVQAEDATVQPTATVRANSEDPGQIFHHPPSFSNKEDCVQFINTNEQFKADYEKLVAYVKAKYPEGSVSEPRCE